jgi:hypothetical protein
VHVPCQRIAITADADMNSVNVAAEKAIAEFAP